MGRRKDVLGIIPKLVTMRKTTNYSRGTKQHTGHVFEEKFAGTLVAAMTRNGHPESVVVTTGTKLDKFAGTDCMIDDIHVDFTAHFSGKNLAWVSKKRIKTNFGYIFFGIRTENKHAKFDDPVVVIGLDLMAGTMKQYMSSLISTIDDKAMEIVSATVDTYFDFCDMQSDAVLA